MKKFLFPLALIGCLQAGIGHAQVKSDYQSIPDSQWRTASDVVSFQPFVQRTPAVHYKVTDQLVQLTNLNPYVNSWFLVQVTSKSWSGAPTVTTFNLENANPKEQSISLNADGTLKFTSKAGAQVNCDLFEGSSDALHGPAYAALSTDPYVSLCDGHVFLRNKQNGRKDWVAWGSSLSRDLLGNMGDQLVNEVKILKEGEYFEGGEEVNGAANSVIDEGGPMAAQVSANARIANSGMGIRLATDTKAGLNVGQWYKSQNFPGVFVSVMKAKFVPDDILHTFTSFVNRVDAGANGENDAIVDLVAMDLSQYTFGWENGTDDPGAGGIGVTWSPRATVARRGPGPDGFANLSPLTFPGVVSPTDVARVVGVMPGGFQRRHSAFLAGPMTLINRSSHYGFMEKGVVMSTLVPNLASFIVNLDGSVEVKTWTMQDTLRISSMRDVRQNGVPLLETDPITGKGIPTRFVNQWGEGNWSGSINNSLKTPRTAMCYVERDNHKYLIMAYFSTHTPSSMARVLQSYQCKYAIHLDMNTPRFSYVAFFTSKGDGDFDIEHLANSMTDDVILDGKKAPRSLLTPVYKDFIYVMKK